MGTHRFSPIRTQEEFESVLEYLARQVFALTVELTGFELPIPIVKVFAQYPEEFDALRDLTLVHGPRSVISSEMSHYVDVGSGLHVAGSDIELLGVRRADPYRRQVGCGDAYIDGDFDETAEKIIGAQPEFARMVGSDHNNPMVELWHPDYDVLGYLIAPMR